MDVKERYMPKPLGVNSTTTFSNQTIGGFLALTSGTLTITRFTDSAVIVNAVPVTAGIWTPIPFFISINGFIVTLAGGASGVLGV